LQTATGSFHLRHLVLETSALPTELYPYNYCAIVLDFAHFVILKAFQNHQKSVIHNRMSKIITNKPVLIMLYGFPGSGKTHFAHELSETLGAAHVQGDRIRYELFENPRYDKHEDEIISHLMEYMAEEFLNTGVSVIFDTNAMRLVQRRALRDIARKSKVQTLLIWLQIDHDSAYMRTSKRDRRRSDDKYARPYTRADFDNYVATMQNPQREDYTVISGKHTFNTQRSAVLKKLYELGIISSTNMSSNVAKPGLVNLVPAGRVDMKRRNVIIR
jgi:predicted kinase